MVLPHKRLLIDAPHWPDQRQLAYVLRMCHHSGLEFHPLHLNHERVRLQGLKRE
jgi:hypothetical protein